ncbi:MAG: tRNA-dihydrouridine synthase, partial [Butyricicoccaceae bacterium]
ITHGGRLAIANEQHPNTADNLTPDTITPEQMERVRGDFIRAAVRAKQADFDGVEVHCAHGYLLSSMISPVYNHRTDEYGGSAENRFRLAEEIILGIREACGTDYPIFIKINSNVEENDEAYEADLLAILRRCEQLGVVAAELSGFNFRAFDQNTRTYYLERAARMQPQCSLPIILVGGIKSLEDMDRALDAGMSMISIARGLLCEPDLILRLKAGQERAKCINCNRCSNLWKENGKRCVFHEISYPRLIEST